jgi:serine/threonine protein kinase
VIHGDLKSKNIMRNHDGKIVLIDFDAAVFLDAVDDGSSNHGCLGSKVSSGFLPPEMLYRVNVSTVAVKSPVEYEKHVLSGSQPPFEPVKALLRRTCGV